MSYQSRKPAHKLIVSKQDFNRLIAILDLKKDIETSQNIKEKILKYAVPRQDENGNEFADMRFFPSELIDIINHFLDVFPIQNYQNSYLLLNSRSNKTTV